MRVAIFIDGKNFHGGWRSIGREQPVDFVKMAKWLVAQVEGSRLWGVHYYTGLERGPAAKTESQQRLSRFLENLEYLPGFFVQRFPRKARGSRCQHCGEYSVFTQEKEVDTTIVADMLGLAAVDAFDIAILLSGDSDHAPAVEGVRKLGKQVYVATWGDSGLSSRIRKAAFDHIDLAKGLSAFRAERGLFEQASPGGGTVDATGSPPTDDEAKAAFLAELALAEARFQDGYVGVNYFLKQWKSSRLDPSFPARNRILQRLVRDGLVEVYPASDGSQALRRKDPPASSDEPPSLVP